MLSILRSNKLEQLNSREAISLKKRNSETYPASQPGPHRIVKLGEYTRGLFACLYHQLRLAYLYEQKSVRIEYNENLTLCLLTYFALKTLS